MTIQDETVLVTGASGFLGGTLALKLAQSGARVRALLRSPEKGKFLQNNPNIELIQGDITAPDKLQSLFDDCAYIFHVAASFTDIASQRKVNVEGTRNVLQAAVAAGVRRVVHVSTIAYYGYRRGGDIIEEMSPAPAAHDPYSRTKAEGEAVVREVAHAHDLSYSIIRPGMIYGPGSAIWTETMFRVARMRPTPWIGNGSGHAHPIYVDDVVDMAMLLATHPAAHGEAFNCAPDPAPTWREWFSTYSRLAGNESWLSIPVTLLMPLATILALFTPANNRLKDAPEVIRVLKGTATYKMDKSRKLLGWGPKINLQTGVAKCAPWLREKGLLR
jgi:2-alkyl-3-oxoalkanoate reductase